jgi:ATP-dependent helicase/nuclease subunit A
MLVHALLARLPDVASEDRRRVAHRFLAARGAAPDEAETLVVQTLGILESAEFAEAFATHSRAEVTVVAELPELGAAVRVNGRIDRLAVTHDAVLVVDFKSDRDPPQRAADVAPVYLAQMALYRAALKKMLPEKVVRCALIWTETPLLMPLPDALLDTALERIRTRLDRPGGGS